MSRKKKGISGPLMVEATVALHVRATDISTRHTG